MFFVILFDKSLIVSLFTIFFIVVIFLNWTPLAWRSATTLFYFHRSIDVNKSCLYSSPLRHSMSYFPLFTFWGRMCRLSNFLFLFVLNMSNLPPKSSHLIVDISFCWLLVRSLRFWFEIICCHDNLFLCLLTYCPCRNAI